jgi:hypothetical protein
LHREPAAASSTSAGWRSGAAPPQFTRWRPRLH